MTATEDAVTTASPGDVSAASDGDVSAVSDGGDALRDGGDAPVPAARKPLYPRLLRLRNIHPNAWQRALLGEGALAVAVLLVLADLATAWILVVLPVAVALVVKAHDLLAGLFKDDQPPARGG